MPEMNFDSFLKEIQPYNYVSFDVFDTLIFRTVSNPEDVWEMVSQIYKERFNSSMISFKSKRVYAERKARQKYQKEVTIDEIYEFFDDSVTICNNLKEIEKDVEVRNCVENKLMLDVIKWCKTQGKCIIIVSDMYLTSDVFQKIFDKLTINFDYLFISGEIGLTKRKGDLFPYVLDKLSISANQLIHIGDDLNNDISQPQRFGIKSLVRIMDSTLINFYHTSTGLVERHLQGFFLNHFRLYEKPNESLFRIGFSVLGPFIYSFCNWVHNKREELALDRLYFLARDGYLIFEIYKLLYPNDEIYYICLNKNMLRLPSLEKHSSEIIEMIPPRPSYGWTELFDFLNISDISSAKRILVEKEVNDEFVLADELKSGRYDRILSELITLQSEKIEEQKNLLREYLDNNKLTSGKVGLVNNSMQGTCQRMLNRLYKSENIHTDIYGIQFVADNKCKKEFGDNVQTFFNDIEDVRLDSFMFMRYCLVFEHLLFEPCGSAKQLYRDKNNRVKVQMGKWGYESLNSDVVSTIQNYAIQFIMAFKETYDICIREIAKRQLLSFLSFPIREDAITISKLWDVDTDGVKPLNNLSSKFSYSLIYKKIPTGIMWPEGFISFNNKKMFSKLYHLRFCSRLYYINKGVILFDIYKRGENEAKHIKEIIVKLLQNRLLLFYRSVLFHLKIG